ncbi:Protein yippee-like [Metarhizium anisopliae]|nr:Protein yippee-like [Metarhizium anisopliae]
MSSEPREMLLCKTCETVLGHERDIESTDFTRQHGPAILITNVYNIAMGRPIQVFASTGWYIIQVVSCAGCKKKVGWIYLKVQESSQLYKLGKFVLELARLEVIIPPAPPTGGAF